MAKGKAKADLNKLQAVREVLDEKGKNTPPIAIQKIIKDKHGVELSTGLISTYKFKLVGAVGKKGQQAREKAGRSYRSNPCQQPCGQWSADDGRRFDHH